MQVRDGDGKERVVGERPKWVELRLNAVVRCGYRAGVALVVTGRVLMVVVLLLHVVVQDILGHVVLDGEIHAGVAEAVAFVGRVTYKNG